MIISNIQIQIIGAPGRHGNNLRFLVVTRQPFAGSLLEKTRCILEEAARPGLQADLAHQSTYAFAHQAGILWKTADQVKKVIGIDGQTDAPSPCYATVGDGRRAVLVITAQPMAFTLLPGVNVLLETGTEADFQEWLEVINLSAAADKLDISQNFMLSVKRAATAKTSPNSSNFLR